MPVYKAKNGTWFFKCSLNGRQFLRRGFSSRREALEAEALFRTQGSPEKESGKKVITFSAVCNLYIDHVQQLLKPTTFYNRKRLVMKHILPHFPDIDVTHLTMNDFQRFRNRYLSTLKETTLPELILMTLNQIFDYLNLYYDINIKYPKLLLPVKDDKIERQDHSVSSVPLEEIRKMWVHYTDYYRVYLLVTLIYGLRISEVRGITISSFDFENNLLYVYKQLSSKTGSGKSVILTPKSNSSQRKMMLFPKIKTYLLDFIEQNHLVGDQYLLFKSKKCKDSGIGETTIRTYLKKIETKYSLRHYTPHQLRHTIGTYLSDNGIPSEIAGKFLGHKKNLTLDVYIDIGQNYLNKIYSLLDLLFDKITIG